MARITMPDGATIDMRIPMRGSEIAALDEAETAPFVRQTAILYRTLHGAALDDGSRVAIDLMTPDDLAELLTRWSGATEDDALPPASGNS